MLKDSVGEDMVVTEKSNCEKCIFCNVIAKNDPNVILQPKVRQIIFIPFLVCIT